MNERSFVIVDNNKATVKRIAAFPPPSTSTTNQGRGPKTPRWRWKHNGDFDKRDGQNLSKMRAARRVQEYLCAAWRAR